MNKIFYTTDEFWEDVDSLVQQLQESSTTYSAIYGVPRGGIPLAVALSRELGLPLLQDIPEDINCAEVLVVDDVVDSGKTRERFRNFAFACLHEKAHASRPATYSAHSNIIDWIVYWWEGDEDGSADDIVTRQLQYIGEDPQREGLLETPKRVLKSWKELFAGYQTTDPGSILKTFKEGACDEMVLLKDIEFFSTCEHHLLPFFGKAHIAYIPNGKVVGVSKLARLLDIFSRRCQIQERIGEQVTTTLMDVLKPKGAACVIQAQHFCMKARGVQKQDSIMVTSSLKGVFLERAEARAEFMGLIR